MIEWPPSIAEQEKTRALGFEWFGHHGRFAVAIKQRGPVALIVDFVVNPQLRDFKYARVAIADTAEYLRSRGVKCAVGRVQTSELSPVWRRLGARETEPGLFRMRL